MKSDEVVKGPFWDYYDTMDGAHAFDAFFGQVILFMLLTTILPSTYITSFSPPEIPMLSYFIRSSSHYTGDFGPIIMELYFTDHTCHPSNSYFCT